NGDEVGKFDENGILDSDGNIGELLVGSGVWSSSQMEITSINSVDLTQFGGPLLPGAVPGHGMSLKIWDSATEVEYEAIYSIGTGSGTFNNLFTAIEEIFYEPDIGDDGGDDGGISDGCDLPDNNFYLDGGSVLYNSIYDIGGFQFSVEGATINGVSGGDADLAGFTVSNSASTVLGFSFTGDVIPSGCGTLTVLDLSGEADGLVNIIVSDSSGNSLDFDYYDDSSGDDGGCDDEDGDGICDDVDDCVGQYDECDVCNGTGIPDGVCDCDGNV
ncbi:uncharacterized protein METZ01_LOCUS418663, partial [marine metagenome]